jgi:RNA polymerase-binding protein DksA
MANGTSDPTGPPAIARGRTAKAAAATSPPSEATTPAPAAQAPVAKVPPSKTPAGKAPPAKTSSARARTAKAPGATAQPAETQPAPTKTSARKATAVTKTTANPQVPAGTAWSASELAEIRTDLEHQLADLRAEYDEAIAELNDMQQFARDGAGDDQADTGTKTFEREQELSIVHNRLDLLTQVERAIERISAGTYGVCEGCGRQIAKARLQAFPSATLCVECKQREERR